MAYKINGTTVVDNSRNVCACCVTSCCITASTRLDAPSGNTASRPASPATGSLYFDTDEGSLLSYDGTSWAAVGGGADPVSFCGMTCLSATCIETLSPAQSISYKCIGMCGSYGPVSISPQTVGTNMSQCYPVVGGGGWHKPFHVASDGTSIFVGMGVNTSSGMNSQSSYTSVISKDGTDAYQVRSGTNSNIYIPTCPCCLESASCACMCPFWNGPTDNNRHIPMLSYSGITDNCNAGYYAHWDCAAIESCRDCGYLVPYASVYNSICPVYRVCGGTTVIYKTLNAWGRQKQTTLFRPENPLATGPNGLFERVCLSCHANVNLFCTGTGLACSEAGFGHQCGTMFWLTRDPTDLRYYPSSGETRSSLDGGTCGKIQGLFIVNCCSASCTTQKPSQTGNALEVPSQNMGVLFLQIPNTANSACCTQIVTWDYSTCCTKIYNPVCCGSLMCCTPWFAQCGPQYRTTQKDPVDNDVYYHLAFTRDYTYGSANIVVCGSKFDFSGGIPCWVCNFNFTPCICINRCSSFPIGLYPVYYDIETCGLVSMIMYGANLYCRMRCGWGYLVQTFDFNNCTYSVNDYSCIPAANTCGWTACRGYFCGGPQVCGINVCQNYANFGMGFSPNGRYTTVLWGACSQNFSRGARGDFGSMISNACSRLQHSSEACEANYKTCLSSTHLMVQCVPFCCPVTYSYSECVINCTFTLQCSGTGILCCGSNKTKYYFGPRCLDQFCCGPATCAANTYNRWPVLHDLSYTMGNVINDYAGRKGSDTMTCSLTGAGGVCGSSP